MRRVGFVVVSMLAMLLSVSVTFAASVHFKPPRGAPTFTDQGLTLNAAGELAGLGFGDVLVVLTATADPTATCTNKGGNEAPGQNPAEVTVEGSLSIPNEQVKNGNTPFNVTTLAPPDPTAEEAGCPNGNWDAEITDLTFKTATITVQQGGQVVLTQTFEL